MFLNILQWQFSKLNQLCKEPAVHPHHACENRWEACKIPESKTFL